MNLANKIVLITGASQGIGAACARKFQERGAKLALVARSEDKLRAVAREGDLVLPGDLLDASFRRQSIERTISHFRRLDVLVNNAGIGLYEPSWSAPMDTTRQMFELNFFAPLDLVHHAVPRMKQQGSGCIVNVSSIGGFIPLPWFTLYSSTKFALTALTDGLRTELRRSNIHCIGVYPAYVKTEFQEHVLIGRPPDSLMRMRRFRITVEECASAIIAGIEQDRETVIVPRAGRLLGIFRALFPRAVDGRLARTYESI